MLWKTGLNDDKEKCHTYVVISENTLQEMLSNPHEFISEVLLSQMCKNDSYVTVFGACYINLKSCFNNTNLNPLI
jgi:hypothetical protein